MASGLKVDVKLQQWQQFIKNLIGERTDFAGEI
jgi:hypothetical protein